MKIKKKRRPTFCEVLFCVHMVLLLMPVISMFYMTSTNRDEVSLFLMFLFSILLIFPTVVSRLSERFIKSFLLNLLLDTAVIAFTGYLAYRLGRTFPSGTVRIGFTVGICLESVFCVQGSLQRRLTRYARAKAFLQHDESWVEPRHFLDRPDHLFLFWFLILYLLGLVFFCPVMCNIALGSGAVYLVIAYMFERQSGVEQFMEEYRYLSHVPENRIRRIGHTATGLLVGICLLGLIPAIAAIPLRRFADLRYLKTNFSFHLPEYGRSAKANTLQSEILREITKMDVTKRAALTWLEPLAYILAGIGAFLILKALVKNIRQTAFSFRQGYDENGDLIRSLKEEEELRRIRRKTARSSGGSGRERIRREYKKTVEKKLSHEPLPSATPAEIEEEAGLNDAALHERYEKARYDDSFFGM